MNAITSDLKEMTGNIAKAVIEIVDVRKSFETQIKEPVKVGSGNGGLGSLTSGVSTNCTERLQDAIGAASVPGSMDKVQKKKFSVPFNPQELSLSGTVGAQVARKNVVKNGFDRHIYSKNNVQIVLKVRLIFDSEVPQDSFMGNKLSTYSVQKEVEAFTAAVRSPCTRQITFNWGNMSYSGVLNQVSAQYTMFNVIGAPVRAIVDLSLMCADTFAKGSDVGAWDQAYSDVFGEGTQSYVKATQKAGSLVNFNL